MATSPDTRAINALTHEELRRLKQAADRFTEAAQAEIQIVQARQRVAEARRKAKEVEAQLLAQMLENQKLSRQLHSPEIRQGPKPAPATRERPALEIEISDEQIHQLALKAVVRLRQVPEPDLSGAWDRWKRELGERFPPYVAVEIAKHAASLWELCE